MSGFEKRLERLEEATHSAPRETPMVLQVYFKHLENRRRERAGEPPMPLTPEEIAHERERDSDPEFRRYFEELEEQREEQWRKERSNNG